MSDRYDGFVVVLEQELRADDAESTIEAIRHIKGVAEVVPVTSSPSERITVETRVKRDLARQLMEIARELLR